MRARSLASVAAAGIAGLAGAQTFPADGDWIPAYCPEASIPPMNDAEGDADGALDVVGTEDDPAAFLARSGDDAAFRVRLDADPAPAGDFADVFFAFAIDTDGTPTTYELMVVLDGAGTELWLYRNDTPVDDDASDVAETAVAGPYDAATRARVVAAGTSEGGDADWFLDLLVPLTAFADQGVGPATPVRVWVGGSDADASLADEVACADGASSLIGAVSPPTTIDPAGDEDADGRSNWAEVRGDAASDPSVADTDGDGLLDGEEDDNDNALFDFPDETHPGRRWRTASRRAGTRRGRCLRG